jgi:uncharacterized protein YjbI with pentapeptide repeats
MDWSIFSNASTAVASFFRDWWPQLLGGAVVAALFVFAWWLWWRLPKRQLDRLRLTIRDAKARADVEDNFRKTMGQLLGGAAVLVGAAFAYLQFQQQQQASHDLLISNQVAKGFEQLGSEKVVVRLGGIYALEGVMNTSDQYHKPVFEALCAFVRDGTKNETGDGPPATDIQAALTVIGRRRAVIATAVPDLRKAHIPQAALDGSNLSDANLIGTNLTGANLRRSNLIGAYLTAADLSLGNLWQANLTLGNLSGANLSGADLHEADLRSATLTAANLTGAVLSFANLRDADLRGADLHRANLAGANLSNADLRELVRFEMKTKFEPKPETLHLERTDLTGAILTGAILTGAILTGANLDKADLDGANLRGATLTGATLNGTKLGVADLRGAKIAQEQLDKACAMNAKNGGVQLDPGLTVQSCK